MAVISNEFHHFIIPSLYLYYLIVYSVEPTSERTNERFTAYSIYSFNRIQLNVKLIEMRNVISTQRKLQIICARTTLFRYNSHVPIQAIAVREKEKKV